MAPHVPEPTEESHPSAPSLSCVSATMLVEGAIAAAHSQITGAPQLLPTNIVTQARSQPSQTFLSAGLPIDSQVSTKIKEKVWNEEFIDFGVLLNNQGQNKYYPKWRGLYYYDRCLPMGCSSSCKTFEAFNTAIEWIARHKFDVDELLDLLDDFLFVSATYIQCQSNLNRFLVCAANLAIQVSMQKCLIYLLCIVCV